MKILHIIGTIDPKAGGPSESVRSLMKYGPIGYSGEVVSFDEPSAPFLKDLTFPVHPLGPVITRYGYTSKLLPWLIRNRHRFDGIVVNGIWQYCGLAAALAMKGYRPYMVFTHGMLDPYFKRAYPLKHIKKAFYWYLAEYWVLRNAYRVLFTTAQEQKLAEQSFALHNWHGHVVPYGSAGPEEDPKTYLPLFEERMPEMKDKRFLLFFGRIHQKKGCDLLVRAFIRTASQDTELHLVIAGPDQQGLAAGLQAQVAEAGLQDRVHWPGMITGNAKWGLLYAAEAFILPSHQENFGIAVAESLACGRPVLVSDQVNIAPEIAEDGAGYMETDTQEGTERLIERWIATSSQQRDQMKEVALNTFRRRYDMKENAKVIIQLFQKAPAS